MPVAQHASIVGRIQWDCAWANRLHGTNSRMEGVLRDYITYLPGRLMRLRLLLLPVVFSLVIGAQQSPEGSTTRTSPQCQSGTTISGVAKDESGARLDSAEVVLRHAVTGSVTRANSDKDGTFRVCVPATGRYRLEVRMATLDPYVDFVEVGRGASEPIDAVLTVGAVRSAVTVVSASRQEELQDETPVRVEAISRLEMQRTGYERVSDVLAEIPGVVTRAGASGGVAGQQIQGLDSRQVLVLQDGLPVIGARGIKRGVVNMNRQSVGRLESVEVVKGGGSAMYGTDAIGGVINMRSREIPDRFDVGASLSGGSLGAVDGRADVGGRYKNLSAFLNVENHRMNSFGLVPNSPLTVQPDFVRNDLLFKTRYVANDRFALGFTGNVYRNDEEATNPAEGGGIARGNTIDSAQNYTLTADFTLSPTTLLQTRAYAARYDESSRTFAQGAFTDVAAVANLNERLGRLDATISHQWGSRHFLQAGGEWSQNVYMGANRLVGDNAGQQVRFNDMWVQDRIRLFNRATLTVGGRIHQHSMFGNQFVPRLGFVWGLNDNWSIRAAYSEGFRAPDLGQLFFRFANPTSFYQVIGNPNLQAESSRSYSTGIQYAGRRFRTSVGVFRNNVNDLIDAFNVGFLASPGQLTGFLNEYGIPGDFNPLPRRLTFVYRNLSQIYTQGVEADVQVSLPAGFRFAGGYAFLDAINQRNGSRLPQRHRHQGMARLDYLRARDGIFATIRGAYFSRWPINPARGTFGFGYQVWDLYSEKQLPARLTLFGAMDNMFNSRDQKLALAEPSFDRPDFGRTFRLGLRFRLSAEQ